ncbi:MAG: hypothetical protein M1831_000369 [Alyxoria varia]|nr:MAG: hypothetical protein M1831_000369 [Alyxoria varia]
MNGESHRSKEGRQGSSRDHYSHRSGRDEHRDRDRRHRSRSPGHRGSRRDFEVDSYSSSRDYREREREDRYRDRRDDRAWDRDRGHSDRGHSDRGHSDRGHHRREGRRDDTDRPPRRDRELFDDRRPRRDRDEAPRGGGEGGGRGGRDRKRSASPPKKKREPTPDLTDVASVLDRKRRMTQWDIKPPGYENVTAEQAKLSGMFPLPGAPRQQPMDPSKLQGLMPPSGTATGTSLSPLNARQAKRLFVYNFPSDATDETIHEFFNLQLNGLNVVSGVDPCSSARISKDGTFALLEFKTAEDATVCLAMDGISMTDEDRMDTSDGAANGASKGLKVERPKEYIVPAGTDNSDEQPGVVSSVVKDSPNKISVANLPEGLTDEQITELLTSFGELKAFVLVKDTGTDQSKGIAFCEFSESSTTDIAVEGLNGMELGEQQLKVQRASIGSAQAAGMGAMGVNAMSMLAGTTSGDLEQGRVIQLLNMVTTDELMNDEDYAEICEDVKEECDKYGQVLEMKVPRPGGRSDKQQPGVGKIFVKYDQVDHAQKALKALAGRKFADRTVVATFFGEEYFDVDAW